MNAAEEKTALSGKPMTLGASKHRALAWALFLLAALAGLASGLAGPTSASAKTPGVPQNRVWENSPATAQSRPVQTPQSLARQRENSLSQYDSVAGDTLAAENAGDSAASSVGSADEPIRIPPGANGPANIGGRDYSGHALDQMQGRGVQPSAIENIIQNGISSLGNTPGMTVYYDSANNLTVITDSASGRVVTVHPGE